MVGGRTRVQMKPCSMETCEERKHRDSGEETKSVLCINGIGNRINNVNNEDRSRCQQGHGWLKNQCPDKTAVMGTCGARKHKYSGEEVKLVMSINGTSMLTDRGEEEEERGAQCILRKSPCSFCLYQFV